MDFIHFRSHWSLSSASFDSLLHHFGGNSSDVWHRGMQIVCGVTVVASVVWVLIIRLVVHFRKSLTQFGHSGWRLFERIVLPRHMISSEPKHILDSLSTRCAVNPLRCKHRVILSSFSLEWHEQIVQILQVLLQEFMRFVIFNSVCELVGQVIDELI